MAGRGLILEILEALALVFLLVNVLNKNTLVLEHVTLSLQIKLVVQLLVKLFGVAVLGQKTAENPLTANPQDLARKASLAGTLALALHVFVGTAARVDDGGLLDDVAILNELADVVPAVGSRDVADLVRVKPDLALAAL